MSKIFTVIDGMTDKTYYTREYENISKLTLKEYVETTPVGYDAESFTCMLTLLGVSPIPRNARSYAEAVGAGIRVEDDDLVFRGTWVKLDEKGRSTGPCAGEKELFWDESVAEYHCLGSYKSLITIKYGAEYIGKVRVKAPHENYGKAVSALIPKGLPVLRKLVGTTMTMGKMLVPWAPSVKAKLPHYPCRAAYVSGTDIVRGIGKMMGMDEIKTAGATGDTDTDLEAKVKAALTAAESYPFVLLHINGADEAAHRRDLAGKKDFIGRVDREVIARLMETEHEIILTCDHGTDYMTGKHIKALQPLYVR